MVLGRLLRLKEGEGRLTKSKQQTKICNRREEKRKKGWQAMPGRRVGGCDEKKIEIEKGRDMKRGGR